jgi:signal transduction histidine kinase
MIKWLSDLFQERGLAPHGFCLLWNPGLILIHVISDALIALAYFSIPVVLWVVLRRRRELEFSWVLGLFASFILACGTTHLLSILVLWVPAYGLEGAVKAFTAAISIFTAIALWPLLPKLLALPSPAQLQHTLDQLRAEIAERERAEEMLRQAQKMQAVGQLTAGIAHDFNNLLTVIGGNLERARRLVGEDANVARSLHNAFSATQRAATVTSQLLAFARKQPLVLQQGNANAVIADLFTFLRETMGSNVQVRVDLADDLPEFVFDRNQLESAIINLAINARDAMPGGGELVLATQLDDQGQIVICARDQGIGMDEDTIARATEPFFTTKPVGAGTGLGLSQVYGFILQMGGTVDIKSTPGAGTIVRLIFPGPGGKLWQEY